MESWQSALADTVTGILWSQWAALGAYLEAEPARKSIIDPEALLVATCAFGRSDARLFDEAMDWILVNHELLKPWRLKRISRCFGPEVQRTLGAVLDFAAEQTQRNLFPGVREEARAALSQVETEELFLREQGRYTKPSTHRQPDLVFARWKLLRGKPRIRGHSGTPDLANPANLMLRLRDYYGAEARADVMTYLLTEPGGSSCGIAAKIKYQQGGVYDVLESLVKAGIAQKRGGRGQAYYWIDQKRVATSLGLGPKRPAFVAWGDVFCAFYSVLEDLRTHQDEYRDEFLASERMRDLILKVVPMLRNAGEALSRLPAPDVKRQAGPEHGKALRVFLVQDGRVLARLAAA